MSKPQPMRWLTTAIPAIVLAAHMPATMAAEADPAIDVATERRPAGEIALSDDTLQLRYLGSIDQVNDARFNGTLFLSEERDLVLSSGLLFPLDFGGGGRFDITAGPQAYAAMLRDENQDVFAISLGTEVRFFFDDRRRYAVSGQAFYAPDILTFGTANNLKDMSARGELQVADRVMVFGGYRWFEFDLTDGSGKRVLQEEVFVGLRYRF